MYSFLVDANAASRRQILRRVRAFTDLDDGECDALLEILKARRGNPGDVLFQQGDRGDTLLVVLDGELVAKVGEEKVARLGPGEVVGEMAFVDAEPRSATVSAPGGATVLEFSREALATLRTTKPRAAASIQRHVLVDVARRLRDASGAGGPPNSVSGSPMSMRRSARALTAEQLRSVPALASYTVEDLELLAYIAQLRTFAAGDIIMREGTFGDACWLLLTGEVAVQRSAQTIARLGPGALVGQLALLDRAPRSATVIAITETAALEVRADAFTNLVRASSPVALRFQWQVALAGVRQLRAATQRLAENASRESLAPMSGRMLDVDDWDDDESPPLELDLRR